jgi:hypothetical protein
MTLAELHNHLLNNLSQQFTKLLAVEAANTPDLIPMLIETMYHQKHPLNWRAAWVIDHIQQHNKKLVEPYLPNFAQALQTCQNNSVKRHLLKMLSFGPIQNLEDGNIIDLCFKWLHSPLTPIASRAFCMQIIFRMIKVYPELANELALILPDIIQNGSKGEKNKATKILAKIKKG